MAAAPSTSTPRFAALSALRDPSVTDAGYESRHRWLCHILLGHVVAIAGYAAAVGSWHVFAELVPVLALHAAAGSRLRIRLRATAVSLGLYATSAIIVHLAHGEIEAHFHFFFVLALVSLYRDALPYAVGIAFVLVEHFAVGMLVPDAVFSHAGDPLHWALVHAGFVAATSVAHLMSWRTVERAHRGERAMLSAELERLAAVVDSAGFAVFSEDLDGTVRSWNEAATALFGYDDGELIGVTAKRLIPAERADELEANLACVRAGQSRTYETVRVTKDGRALEVVLVVSPVRDSTGAVVGASVMARDISQRKAVEQERAAHQRELARHAEELSRLAFSDPLTGLANRALFLDRVDQAAARMRRAGNDVALLMTDLDGFKHVNDTAGHAAGDELLKQVAARLKGCVRDVDTVARLGGDEFAIVLEPGSDPAPVADRVVQALSVPYDVAGRLFTATGSVGIARLGPDVGPAEAMRRADVALYAAKAAGKNGVQTYDARMSHDLSRRAGLEHDLRTALDGAQLQLAYQAVADLRSGQVDGFEALVRWDHPTDGAIPPAVFVPIAEDTGLIVPLGTWVLQQATAAAAALSARAQRPVTVAVKVSVRQLERPDFGAVVAAALKAAALPATQLVLEVTESALADSDAAVVRALREARATGVRVAIDDFGTGYSSLDRLRTLPVDQLKIDRSFISEIDESARPDRPLGAATAPVLAAIVAMAAALELQVVAEGVETAAQLEALRRMECDLAQGYLLARPAPLAHAHALVAAAVPFDAITEAVTAGDDDGGVLALTRLVRTAAMSGDYDADVMSQLLRAVCARTGLETAFFASVDEAEGVQRVLYAHNEREPLVEAGLAVPWEHAVCRAALTTGRWESRQAAEDYPASVAAQAGVNSYCGVPMLDADGDIVATLCAVDRSGRRPTEGARQFLSMLSRILGSRPVMAATAP